jgi:hypothetical protein
MNVGFWILIYFLVGIVVLLDSVEQERLEEETILEAMYFDERYELWYIVVIWVIELILFPFVYYTWDMQLIKE